jgi:hypothetical protein
LATPTLATPNITSGLTLTSAAGTSGQVLTSAGSGVAPIWTTPSTASGTVTSVATGTGLTGGPITTTGTIAIDSTVATLTGTQTLQNKTLGSGTVMPAGSVVQVAYAELLTSGTTSAAIPADDTIPQNTEGTEILTLTMTPNFASSYLLVQVIANLSENTDVAGPQGAIAAIFRDSTADAIAADFALGDAIVAAAAALNVANFSFCFRVAATAATATTFKLRVGGETAVAMRWNGFSGGRKLGGSWRTSMTVTEIAG